MCCWSRRDLPGPAHHAGNPHPPLVGPALASAKGLVALLPVGAIVGGEEDQRLLVESLLLQLPEDLAHGPVQLLDRVPVLSISRFTLELHSRIQGKVNHGMGYVEEERHCLVLANEANGFLGVAAGDGVLLHRCLDDLLASNQGQRYVFAVHIIAVGNPVVAVKTLGGRQEIRMVPEMPLADAAGGVAPGFENFGYGQLRGVESLARRGKEHTAVLFIDVHVDAPGITAGHQARA